MKGNAMIVDHPCGINLTLKIAISLVLVQLKLKCLHAVYYDSFIDTTASNMAQKYRHDHTSVSLLNYHFVWIVRRRKKILFSDLDERLKTLIDQAVKEIECETIALDTDRDHVHLFINAHPRLAPYQIIHKVKGYTSHYLRKEFPWLKQKLPSLWTRSYFVSTAGQVSGDTIRRYVEQQKKD